MGTRVHTGAVWKGGAGTRPPVWNAAQTITGRSRDATRTATACRAVDVPATGRRRPHGDSGAYPFTLADVPKWFYTRCRDCNASVDDGAQISRRGFCDRCGAERAADAVRAMVERTGPKHERWVETRGGANVHARRTGVGGRHVLDRGAVADAAVEHDHDQ